jgi:hypothetical protein
MNCAIGSIPLDTSVMGWMGAVVESEGAEWPFTLGSGSAAAG